jgi:UPF0271 protein
MKAIDINCDMGEIPSDIFGGAQEAILPYVSSINVACGGHAGDDRMMLATVEQARRFGVAVGAHPGYPDRENFGRVAVEIPLDAISESVFEQVRALSRFSEIAHVKPHGALYNRAAHDRELARAIAEGVARFSRDVVLLGLASSPMLEVFEDAGFAVAAEAFADRTYEADGTLRSRKYADALIQEPQTAAEQAVTIALSGNAQTLCIHSDTPGATSIAEAVNARLRLAGFTIRPLAPCRG